MAVLWNSCLVQIDASQPTLCAMAFPRERRIKMESSARPPRVSITTGTNSTLTDLQAERWSQLLLNTNLQGMACRLVFIRVCVRTYTNVPRAVTSCARYALYARLYAVCAYTRYAITIRVHDQLGNARYTFACQSRQILRVYAVQCMRISVIKRAVFYTGTLAWVLFNETEVPWERKAFRLDLQS